MGLRFVDRIILIETFLHWSASHAHRLFGLSVPIAFMLFGLQAMRASAADALWYFAPFFVFQVGGLGWLSEWRCLPILGDLSGLLAATDILKSVYRGLTKPMGQKFQVTAKGGDRSKRFIQTPMLTTFLGFLTLTVLSIWVNFLSDPARDLQAASLFALFWSWYNMVVLVLACIVCIEQPRLRRSERFAAKGEAQLIVDGRAQAFAFKDISTGGVGLRGRCPLAVGDSATMLIGEISVVAKVVRVQKDEFALAVEDNFETRASMVRAVYSGRFDVGVAHIEPGRVASGLARRVFA